MTFHIQETINELKDSIKDGKLLIVHLDEKQEELEALQDELSDVLTDLTNSFDNYIIDLRNIIRDAKHIGNT